jgi:hypothetical protein
MIATDDSELVLYRMLGVGLWHSADHIGEQLALTGPEKPESDALCAILRRNSMPRCRDEARSVGRSDSGKFKGTQERAGPPAWNQDAF